jgi:alanine racemase
MRIGVVACGYADGYPRHALSEPRSPSLGCARALSAGVSMDMLCADITDIARRRG